MDNSKINPQDYIRAHDVVAHLARNMSLDFQVQGFSMSKEQAKTHFRDREALNRVQALLLDQAELTFSIDSKDEEL